MSRQIKFRAWDDFRKKMIYDFQDHGWAKSSYRLLHEEDSNGLICGNYLDNEDWNEPVLMQFTGFQNRGKDLYEYDIIRIEEPTDDIDKIFYVVIVWVKEWGMFATLMVDEYKQYIEEGVSALDEPLFWTYALTDTDSRKHFPCGNIFETPALLDM